MAEQEVDWTLPRRIPLRHTTTYDDLLRIKEVLDRRDKPDDGDLAGDHEPRNPTIPPHAGAIALELVREEK